jgi:hypothetical protein
VDVPTEAVVVASPCYRHLINAPVQNNSQFALTTTALQLGSSSLRLITR